MDENNNVLPEEAGETAPITAAETAEPQVAEAAPETAGPQVAEAVPEKPAKPKKKKPRFLALKIIAGVILFAAIAVGSGFAAVNIKYDMMEREVNETPPISHGEIERGIATKELCDFYFNTLTYREQLLYNNIKNAAEARAEKSEVMRLEYDMETFSKVARYVLADNPDLFYVNFDRLVLNHARHRTYVAMAYCATGDELETIISEYENALSEMISAAADAISDFGRELALHDYIIDKCEYAVEDEDHLHNTAYGALVFKRAYCDGYAYAMKAAMDRLGIQSAIVYGSVNGTDHVWNLVYIDGEYYHLDAMWDDADITFSDGMRFHGYFNLNDERIRLDHEYKFTEVLPKAEGTEDYYRKNGLYAETAGESAEIITRALVDASARNSSYIELFCAETAENEKLAPYYREAVEKANDRLGGEVFLSAFRVFSASDTSNAVTIQVFYSSPVEEETRPPETDDKTDETDDQNPADTAADTNKEGN